MRIRFAHGVPVGATALVSATKGKQLTAPLPVDGTPHPLLAAEHAQRTDGEVGSREGSGEKLPERLAQTAFARTLHQHRRMDLIG